MGNPETCTNICSNVPVTVTCPSKAKCSQELFCCTSLWDETNKNAEPAVIGDTSRKVWKSKNGTCQMIRSQMKAWHVQSVSWYRLFCCTPNAAVGRTSQEMILKRSIPSNSNYSQQFCSSNPDIPTIVERSRLLTT